MGKRILVPVDGSIQSDEAFSYAIEEYADEEIVVINVVDPQNFYTAAGIEGGLSTSPAQLQDSFEKQSKGLLEEKQDEAAERGIDIEVETLTGAVANTIVSYAESNDIDHIVMGSRGRTGAGRILLGSVAERVTRRSPVSVTIVR